MPRIANAIHKSGRLADIHDIIELVWAGEAKVFEVVDGDRAAAVIVVEVTDEPAGRTMTLAVGGSDTMAYYDVVMDALIPWAKQHGCTRMEVEGRKGWLRALGSRGWEHISTRMGREI